MKRSATVSPPAPKRIKSQKDSSDSVEGSQLRDSAKSKELLPGSNLPGHVKTMRLFSWNINGVSLFLQRPITSFVNASQTANATATRIAQKVPAAASLRDFLCRHSWPELLFLQEVKINTNDTKTQRTVERAVNLKSTMAGSGPVYLTFFTLPRDKYNAKGFGGKLYGVCTIIEEVFYNQYVSSVTSVPWDQEGRVSVVSLYNKMAIYNIYAVNGTSSPYWSPASGEVVGTRHEHKRNFHKLLAEECKRREHDGWHIIIAGDLNVAPERIDGHPNLRTFPAEHVTNRADFRTNFLIENEKSLGVVDVWRRLNPNVKKFTYHPRNIDWGLSCDRVDLVLVSKVLFESGRVIEAEIWDSPQERSTSDHVPISIQISLA